MGNKLKDIFSDNKKTYESQLRFKDNDAYRNFLVALDTVGKDGSTVAVDGIESVSLFLQDHGIKFPLKQSTNITKFMIGPSKKTVSFPIKWENGEKNYIFTSYPIDEGTVFETAKTDVVYLRLVFPQDLNKVSLTYKIHYQNANNVNEIAYELEACINFFKKFRTDTISPNEIDDAKNIRNVILSLKYAKELIDRLLSLEEILNVTFEIEKVGNMTNDDQMQIEELYLLLCKKTPLRLNEKFKVNDSTQFEITDVQKEIKIGANIAGVFHREDPRELFGQKFTLYIVETLLNAIIKDYKTDENTTHIYYGDTDTNPMYISYLAFLNEDDAEAEANKTICGDPKYIKAITTAEHLDKRLKKLQKSKL